MAPTSKPDKQISSLSQSSALSMPSSHSEQSEVVRLQEFRSQLPGELLKKIDGSKDANGGWSLDCFEE